MSKATNTWYVLFSPFRSMFRTLTRPALPDRWTVGFVFVVAAIVVGTIAVGAGDVFMVGADGRDPVQILMPYALVVALVATAIVFIRQLTAFGRSYFRALKEPGPNALVTLLDTSFRKASALPDMDAQRAHSVAVAYALYGFRDDAMRALASVNWGKRAPLIQATGLVAEALTQLLCDGDAAGALERCTKARALGSVSKAVPGAAQSERFFRACIALCEVLAKVGSDESVRALEAGAASRIAPVMRVLASFGLAVAMEQRGDVERARAMRSFLLGVAPHCESLHRRAEDFSPRAQTGTALPMPVTFAMESPDAWAPPASEVTGGKRAPLQGLMGVALTIAITFAFLVVWALLGPGE
jgi:hypothetical protein